MRRSAALLPVVLAVRLPRRTRLRAPAAGQPADAAIQGSRAAARCGFALQAGPAERRRRSRTVVAGLRRPDARPPGGADRRLQPDPEDLRGQLSPGARARPAGPVGALSQRSRAPARRSRPAPAACAARRPPAARRRCQRFNSSASASSRPASRSPGRSTCGAASAAQVESDSASAQASDADLAKARLSAQTDLVINYFSLRISDQRKRLYEATVAAYVRSMQIAQNQVDAGIVSRVDLAQAQTHYEQTRARSVTEGINRALFEHAIALLVGKAPSEVDLEPGKTPAHRADRRCRAFPSTLLERRPDIASAERQMAAANAQIGVAQGAPTIRSISLGATISFLSGGLGSLLQLGTSAWSRRPADRRHAGRRRRAWPHRSRARGPATTPRSRPIARPS